VNIYKSKTICTLAAVITGIAVFTVYELRVDGSILGSLWQLLRGNHVEYSGLTISLPRHWVAVRLEDKLILVGVAGHNTADVVFQKIPGVTPNKWKQNRLRWVEMRQTKYRSEGYESVTPPPITVLGEPATCVEAVSQSGKGRIRIECGIDEGHMLVSFTGTENDVPKFVSLLDSLHPAPGTTQCSAP
jgi:hypothetical protein